MWFYWDGIAFFGFADFKLPRIMGKKPGFFDKFTSVKNLIIYTMMIGVLAYILISNIAKLGLLK